MVQAKFGMGASLLRKEDDAFIKGEGQFSDDIKPEDVLTGFVLRSPYAHASFEITDIQNALNAKGIHLVLTADDIGHLKALSHQTPLKNHDGRPITNRDIPILCDKIVRHVGDAIAFIVADNLNLAKDPQSIKHCFN